MKNTILIYGNTCAGKSTIGRLLSREFHADYLEFGDLKRKEIASNSSLGQRIKFCIENGNPINPSDGFEIIKNRTLSPESIILSGFPISTEELCLLRIARSIIGVIVMDVDDITVRQRFLSRGICPTCNCPGRIGSKCQEHNINLIRRQDANEEELSKRLNLYGKRIKPFIERELIPVYPTIKINATLPLANTYPSVKSFIYRLLL
ncbi:MAG: nucleoside monophosphate kinase [Patescibacteria group bacterium]|nr:nucleoside monophosphate kinase [Patescibacteria group bacterium]